MSKPKMTGASGAEVVALLIRAAQGHDYHDSWRTEDRGDRSEQDFHAMFGTDHLCPVFDSYRIAAAISPQYAQLLGDEFEIEPPTCPRPSFNPLTTEAYISLPSVEKLLHALANWLTTRTFERNDLRPTKVGGQSAERMFMLRVLSRFFSDRLGGPAHKLVAATVRTAFDLPPDDPFNESHVGKAVR